MGVSLAARPVYKKQKKGLPDSAQKRIKQRRDVFTGGLLFLLGLTTSWLALDFDSASRPFPLLISGLLSAAGLAVAFGALFRPRYSAGPARQSAGVILAVIVIAAWTLAIAGGAGFVLPTFVMQILLLRITGVRGPFHLPGIAALVTALAFLLFVVLLNIPMPPSRLPAMLQGF